jgi:catechol 2,3-dioxygenase-like lactoylglutathione lyase family enzyme
MSFDLCIDVDDVARAVRFYADGIGFELVKQEAAWAQLKAGGHTVWIMKIDAGRQGPISRDYSRHWTPLHLDIKVADMESAIARAVAAGGKLESRPKPELANFSDPAGNGVDLVLSK